MDTLAPPQLQQPSSSPLPSLPTEIIHRIIQLALPRVSYGTYTERYDTLLSFSRVNKLWGELAQRELVRHVRVTQSSGKNIEGIVHIIPSHCRPDAHSLWVTNDGQAGPVRGVDVVRCALQLPALRRIEVALEDNEITRMDLRALFKAAPALEYLLLDSTTFLPPPASSTLRLPVLRHLALVFLGTDATASLLSTAALPQLESLLVFSEDKVPSSHVPALEAAVALRAPRLRSFGLVVEDDPRFELASNVWSTFTRLENLLVHFANDISTTLSLLRHPLTCLRMYARDLRGLSLTPILSTLHNTPPAMSNLKKLVLPSIDDGWVPPDETVRRAELLVEQAGVCQRCEHRGVVVEQQPAQSSFVVIERLEGLLEFWGHP